MTTVDDGRWVLFKVNSHPILMQEGRSDLLALLDARSGKLLAAQPTLSANDQIIAEGLRSLIEKAESESTAWPSRLQVTEAVLASLVRPLVEPHGVRVEACTDADVAGIIGEARTYLRASLDETVAQERPYEATSSEDYSPYGPIRMRRSPYWLLAKRLAAEGWIRSDGRIGLGLYDLIDSELLGPALEYASKTLQNTADPFAYGTILAKLFSYRDWVPLVGQYEACGRQIFDLNDRLTEMLVHTDVGEVTLQDLHLPYDACFIRFGARSEIRLPFEEGRWEYVDGAFVAWTPYDEAGERRLKLGFATVHEDGLAVGYPGPTFDLLPEELKLPVPDAIARALQRRVRLQATPEPGDNESVQALKSYIRQEAEDSGEVVAAAASLLVNALFYLESIEHHLPSPSPGRDTPPDLLAKWMSVPQQRRHKQVSRLTADGYAVVRMVGGEIDAGSKVSTGAGLNRKVHWRRGHWRMQRHGEALAQRKRIWIKPTLVGADHSDSVELPGRIYVPSASNTPN